MVAMWNYQAKNNKIGSIYHLSCTLTFTVMSIYWALFLEQFQYIKCFRFSDNQGNVNFYSIKDLQDQPNVFLMSERTMPVRDEIKSLGFAVLETSDAINCLSSLQLANIDIFLLDISMPEMNGWQLLEELRARGIKAPVIMVSADAYEAPLLQGSPHPLHNDYLAKPIRDNALLDKIAKALKLSWNYHATPKWSPKLIDPIQASKVSLCQEQRKLFRELWEMAQLGFVQGIDKILNNLECDPSLLAHTSTLRKDLEQYQFSKIKDYCEKVLAAWMRLIQKELY